MTLGTGTIQGHSDPHTFTGGHSKWAPHGVGGVQMSGFYSVQSLQRPQLLCFRKSNSASWQEVSKAVEGQEKAPAVQCGELSACLETHMDVLRGFSTVEALS